MRDSENRKRDRVRSGGNPAEPSVGIVDRPLAKGKRLDENN